MIDGVRLSKPIFWRHALLLGMFLVLFMQGSRGLLETTEGRYAECARETIKSANPLEPTLNGVHHWTKPPLTYWAIGAGTELFGNNAWGARAYLVPTFLGTVLAVETLDEAMFAEGGAGLASLVFVTSPMALAAANTVATDALLMLAEAWGLACFWLGVRRQRRRYINFMWLAIALAVTIKGPVGLIPLAAIIPASYMLRKQNRFNLRLFTPEGLLIFCLIGLSWYAYVIVRYPSMLNEWIGVEIIGRLEYDAHHRASSEFRKVFINYIPIMLLGTGPWLLWLLWIKRQALKFGAFTDWLKDKQFGVENSFLFLGIAAQFLLFSASTSRMPLYLAPLFVPMAVMVGRGLQNALSLGAITGKTVLRVALVTAFILGSAKAVSAMQSTWKDMSDVAEILQENEEIRAGAPLTALYHAPLNGLEFHLGRRIPTIYFKMDRDPEQVQEMTKENMPLPKVIAAANVDLLPKTTGEGTTSITIPANSLVLVRSKDLDDFEPYVAHFGLSTVTESKHWSLLRLNKPIAVVGVEFAEEEEKD